MLNLGHKCLHTAVGLYLSTSGYHICCILIVQKYMQSVINDVTNSLYSRSLVYIYIFLLGTQDDLSKDGFGKNDRDRKIKNSRRSKIETSCVENPNILSIKKVASLSKSSVIEKCVIFDQPDSTNQQLLSLPEVISKEMISSSNPSIETDNRLNNDSSSSAMINLNNFPNYTISPILEDNSGDNISSNRKMESNRQHSTYFSRNILNSGHKRKPNRRIVDSVEKKLKKSDTISISKPDTSSNNCKTFGKNTMRFQYSKSITDSPMKIFRDNLEIYDSLSDVDQGNVLEEDFSYQKSNHYINCSNLLNIDWSGIKCNLAFKGQADSFSSSCLLSEIGLSYSLLGSDIYTQCLNKIFQDNPSTKGCSHGLSIGAIIEESIFLEKERLRMQFEQFSHFGFVKTKDIYLRAILSGYSVDSNSNSVPVAGNTYVSSCMCTDLFHSALNIYQS